MKKVQSVLWAFFVACIMLPLAAPAQEAPREVHAQDPAAQIKRLQDDVNILQKEFYRLRAPVNVTELEDEDAKYLLRKQQEFQAAFQLRITDIETQLRELTGKIEEQEHTSRKVIEEVRKFREDVDYRLILIEQDEKPSDVAKKLAPQKKKLNTVVLDPDEKPFVKKDEKKKDIGDPKKRYDAAFLLVRQAKYKEAQAAYEEFVQDFPEHMLTGSAYFWLAETHYSRKDYETAAVEYMKGYRVNQTGPKAPDNLLKLGISLGKAKKRDEACTVFAKLGKEFPNAAAPIRRKAEVERTKLNCGK